MTKASRKRSRSSEPAHASLNRAWSHTFEQLILRLVLLYRSRLAGSHSFQKKVQHERKKAMGKRGREKDPSFPCSAFFLARRADRLTEILFACRSAFCLARLCVVSR